ncbi:Ku protein [Methyloceanibacter caenitepidi]|uniref:Non-homologous end joining protein Ku n=1 Tax=Methyloceanibacter caenitepidi TaxID=1384459 RepID=A0A0A8JYE9_9HYPH|nr:Ku protein [Methyloceanibacter caenitepidi]BAQ15625.1 Ku domain protein [Methyloceanibacter caenitepidi]
MATRAYWKGHLRLSLVSIGIELYAATASASRLSLHQIHKPSGQRVRYQKVAPGVGPIDIDEIVKGFEVGKDEYVLLEPEELDEIKLESKRTIDLVQFVDSCEIDPRYYYKPYYVVPEDLDVSEEGFAVIRDALRETDKVGLGQMAVRGRDYVIAIRPSGRGLLLETLRYEDEIRKSDQIFGQIPDVKVDKDMLNLAEELIERKSAPFDPEAFKSQYTTALRDLINEKSESGAVTASSDDDRAESRDNVIDLMSALKKSIAKDKMKPGRKRSEAKSARTKSSRRKTTKRAAG